MNEYQGLTCLAIAIGGAVWAHLELKNIRTRDRIHESLWQEELRARQRQPKSLRMVPRPQANDRQMRDGRF